jgi:hypothetical protein
MFLPYRGVFDRVPHSSLRSATGAPRWEPNDRKRDESLIVKNMFGSATLLRNFGSATETGMLGIPNSSDLGSFASGTKGFSGGHPFRPDALRWKLLAAPSNKQSSRSATNL